jgi:hypothetical protein
VPFEKLADWPRSENSPIVGAFEMKMGYFFVGAFDTTRATVAESLATIR